MFSLPPQSETAVIVLHVLGQCLIRTAITSVTPRADMCFALASYLTRDRGKRFPRRTIEKFFWPGMHAPDASHSLTELIRKLRDRGVPIRSDDASCIWLPRDSVTLDVESLANEPPAQLAERDLTILPGYSPRASANFRDWVDEWRTELQRRVLREVSIATSRAVATHDWDLAIGLATQILAIDPTNGDGLRTRAEAAARLAGDAPLARANARSHAGEYFVQPAFSHSAVAEWPARRVVGSGARDTELVGRDEQMHRLREYAAQVLRGEFKATYIYARAGMGKSRLVREIVDAVHGSGLVTCVVSCERHHVDGPLSTFIQAVPKLQSLPGAAGCAPSAVACLGRITQLRSDPVRQLDDNSDYVFASVQAAVLDLIDAVAEEQPLLLIVEDVHWIDHASWALLRTIAANAPRSVFMICTSRVAWKEPEWGPSGRFHIEQLPALDATSAGHLIRSYLERASRSAPDSYIEWCADTANGSPYFIEELINYWLSTGEQFSAPPSLISLTAARISCVAPTALKVLQAAAILGKNSTVELLQHVLELPTHTLFSSIEALAEAELLTVSTADINATVSVLCRHDLITQAATRGMSAPGRALLHHAAARAMEFTSSPTGQSAESLWDCAHHWHLAGQPDRSVRAAVACARHLHDMGLVNEAIRRCEAALGMAASDAARTAVLRVMAESQYAARNWSQFCDTVASVRNLETAAGSVSPAHDDLELCELNARRNLHRDWDGALEAVLRCVSSVHADNGHKVKASITALKIATNVGRMDIMEAIYRGAVHLADSPDVSLVDRLTLRMVFTAICGDPTVAAEAARELLLVAKRTLAERHQVGILIDCAGALRRGSNTDEASEVYESIFQSGVKLKCFDVAAEACHRLIEMHCDEGRMDRAETWVVRYKALLRPAGELESARNLRIAIAKVHLWKEEWDEAAELLEMSQRIPPWEDPVAMFRCGALAVKVRLEIGRHEPVSRIAHLTALLAELSRKLRHSGAQDYECFSLYLGYIYSGEVDAGEAFLRNYVERERRDARPVAPEISRELYRLDAKRGTPAEALELPGCVEATDAKCV
jgi:hypothetical protein